MLKIIILAFKKNSYRILLQVPVEPRDGGEGAGQRGYARIPGRTQLCPPEVRFP